MSLLNLVDSSTARVRARVEAHAKPVVRWGLGHGLPRTVIGRASRRGDVQGRLIQTAATPGDDPALLALLEEIRGQGPLVRGGFSHITVSHAVVKEVLSSNDFSAGLPLPSKGVFGVLGDWSESEYFNPVRPPSLLVTEPPDHTRYRRLVTRVFSARAVEQLRSRTEQIAAELLDDLDPTADAVDLVDAYCGLLPVTVISEVLGVPLGMRRRILELGGGAAASLDIGLGWGEFRAVEAALQEFDSWLTGHLERLRRDPGDDLLSQLVHAQEDGAGLSELEIKATAGLVLAAGFETTVNLLGNGIALLRRHPDQLERLRAEPDLWPNAVDEILRYDPPVLLTGRVASVDTTVAGREIRAGNAVTTVLAGANRDPEVFTDPAVFDVARANAREHVSFSAGRHYCLGAQLARMEGEVGLRALFDRFPDLELLPGAQRRSTRILRGYEHLPARLNGR